MRVLINGNEMFPEPQTISWTNRLGDAISDAKFSLIDENAELHFDGLEQVVILEEPDYPNSTHNLIVDPSFQQNGSRWIVETPASLSYNPATGTATFDGDSEFETISLSQTTRRGWIQPDQIYKLSFAYATTNFSNIRADFIYITTAANGAQTTTTTSVTTNTSGTFTADISTAGDIRFITVKFALINLAGGTSGDLTITRPQLERVYPNMGISYPTPSCVAGQQNCTVLGDGTVVRQNRLFAGLLTKADTSYIGSSSSRVIDIEAAGGAILLAKTDVTADYSGFTDKDLIKDLIAVYRPNDVSTRNVIGSGTLFEQRAWQDVPITDILNTVTKSSSLNYWVDQYFDLHVQTTGYSQASYNLSDEPDNVSTFAFYGFKINRDWYEIANQIRVSGGSEGQKIQPAKTEFFTGNGSNKVFTLGNIPRAINEIVVGSTKQKVGVKGKDSFAGGYDVLVNKASRQLTFDTAPPSAANNVAVTYTYNDPSAVRLTDAQSVSKYGYTFADRIDDSSLVTQADVYQRGIVALREYSDTRISVSLQTEKKFEVGDTVGITHRGEMWINRPFVVQSVETSIVGNTAFGEQIREYDLELGSYVPSFVQHLLHVHKKIKRKSTHVSTPAQEFVVAFEPFIYQEIAPSATIDTGGGGGGPLIPLTVSGTMVKSSTGRRLTSNVSVPPDVDGLFTRTSNNTGWGEIRTVNGDVSWPSLGAPTAPTGRGFTWESDDLEGHTLQAGNWVISLRFGGVPRRITGNLVTRIYKRSASGMYIAIGTATLSSQTFTSTYASYNFAPAAMSAMSFIAGDRLYIDNWLQILTNTNTSGQGIYLAAVATASPGSPLLSWQSPGYI